MGARLLSACNRPRLREVATTSRTTFPNFIRVDRDAAMRLGVTMQAVQDVLYDSFGQRQISTIFSESNQYRVCWSQTPHGRPILIRCCNFEYPARPVCRCVDRHCHHERTVHRCGRAPGAISINHAQLQPRPGGSLGEAVDR